MKTPTPEDVAAFIRAHGVTRCPPAACAPTQAELPAEAAAAHAARGADPVGDAWRHKRRFGWARYWQVKRARNEPAPNTS